MDLEMVLNELSLRSPANDMQTARRWMGDFVDTVRQATKSGVKRVIRTEYNLRSTMLSYENGYTVGSWLKDNEVDQVVRTFFLGLVTPEPFLKDILDEEIRSNFDLSQFFYLEEEARGLGVAFLCNVLALSIRSDPRWNSSLLELKFVHFDGGGEVIDESVEVTHASHKDHVLEHAEWIKGRINKDIRDGSDLWEHREELFPSLLFCESVGNALEELSFGNSPLWLVEKKLFDLEKFCQQWQEQGGAFDLQKVPLKGSVESEAALKQYRQQHTFRCPDGEYRLFSLHIRITGYWRLHYFPVEENQQMIIGYIGEHLPTKKYPG
jgi:hypothetical protein